MAPPDSFLDSLRPDASRLRGRALRTAPTLLTLAEGASGPVEAILAWRGTPEIRPDIAAWLDQLAGEYRQAKVNDLHLPAGGPRPPRPGNSKPVK